MNASIDFIPTGHASLHEMLAAHAAHPLNPDRALPRDACGFARCFRPGVSNRHCGLLPPSTGARCAALRRWGRMESTRRKGVVLCGHGGVALFNANDLLCVCVPLRPYRDARGT
ncbi:unnamed protein product [Chondrus crispus]|uniref:Uncharacterized protein n=1 Tax=Chondrus crispus TaxID=2769 RepID=R7Q4M9_CHOCR|nr:unnamed protein product [Chondrus crispus]CDF32964.1 unnamed protein product [Chondrus crispus]|eukprot:XP_005712767.1 unnamed protein product [Chondrus crispus]